jgi:predicted O-methyltransferase YrrM
MFERLRPFFKPPSRPCRVNVDGLAYDVMTDPAATDPVTLAVRDGKNQSADLVRVMLKLVKPGDVVLDLGANIGTVALAAAAIGCRVVAIEASPVNASLLTRAVKRNGFQKRMTVIHAAATDSSRVVNFQQAGR